MSSNTAYHPRQAPFFHFPSSSDNKFRRNRQHQNLDRLLSRAPPQANYTVNYDNFTIRIPNYSFGKPSLLAGSGGLIAIATGIRLDDETPVLVKLSPYAVRLEREYYLARRLYKQQPDGEQYVPQVIELVALAQDGLTALIYLDDGYTPQPSGMPDVAQFLDFAIQCCSCLHFLHASGTIHGELRPSAFQQWRGAVKIWNFGAGLKSYEDMLLTSVGWRRAVLAAAAVAAATQTDDVDTPLVPTDEMSPPITDSTFATARSSSQEGLQNALAYVSPEQTGRTSNVLDHRTDLYSLGIMFFVTLTGQIPFSGSPMSIIHAALSQNVPLAHTVRMDIPPVLSLIIDKLTRKAVDERYDSAYGVREDLLECRRRLSSQSSPSSLQFFPLGTHDVKSIFQFPPTIYGRDKELETIRLVTRRLHHHASFSTSDSSPTQQQQQQQQQSQTQVQQQQQQQHQHQPPSPTSPQQPPYPLASHESSSGEVSQTSSGTPRYETSSTASTTAGNNSTIDRAGCQVVVITGQGGIGKSTLVSAIHTHARQYGYLASSKFDSAQKRPYHGLLRCLSSVLRQLLTESEAVIHDFYQELKEQLGPHFSNVHLMVGMVPELKPILSDHDWNNVEDDDMIPNINTESRFHAVFLNVIRTITRKKPITLCLDDLQEADEPSLHLISSLIASRMRMLIILTCRDGNSLPECIREEIDPEDDTPDVEVTFIKLAPLDVDALLQLVSDTLHRSPEDIQPLVDIIYHRTHGNPFYAKQFMIMMKRKNDIWLDWDEKQWKFRLDNIAEILYPPRPFNRNGSGGSGMTATLDDVLDVRHLVSHLKDMDPHAQVFLMWASLIGSVFDFRQIKWLMMSTDLLQDDDQCSDLSDSMSVGSSYADICTPPLHTVPSETIPQAGDLLLNNSTSSTTPPATETTCTDEEIRRDNQAMAGLQTALQEGIIQPKMSNEYQFVHDRYRQAASMLVDEKDLERMHLRIGQMLMIISGNDTDVFLTADHIVKSTDLIKRFKSRQKYRQTLMKAGDEALSSGALQVARPYYECAMTLLSQSPWDEDQPDASYRETLDLHMRVAELQWWDNRREEANRLLDQIMTHTTGRPVERAQAWRVQARMYFQEQQIDRGIQAIMDALKELGMQNLPRLDPQGCLYDVDSYQRVKQQILDVGIENLASGQPGVCLDRRKLAIMTLLSEACTGAYWLSPHLVDTIAIRLVQASLEHGYGAATGGGFIWLGCTAMRVGEYAFGAELGRLGMGISERYGGNSEIARSIIIHYSMLSQWSEPEGAHYRDGIPHFQRAFKYAIAGGDKSFAAMSLFNTSTTLFYTGCNLAELQSFLNEQIEEYEEEETKRDVLYTLNVSLWRAVLALQGKTTVETSCQVLDDSDFDELGFVKTVRSQSANPGSPLNWHWSFKIIVLMHFHCHHEAAQLGFKILETSINHPGHRHIGIALFYHCVAMIEGLRDPTLDDNTRAKYIAQTEQNRVLLKEWSSHSSVNYEMYYTLVEAELSSLSPETAHMAPKLYNDAIELGSNGDWFPFLAFAYQLAGTHYLRTGMKMLGAPMIKQSLDIYNGWGAWGTARHLAAKHQSILKTTPFVESAISVATQTDETDSPLSSSTADSGVLVWEEGLPDPPIDKVPNDDETSEAAILSLDIVDLTSIIKSSQVISNEMNSFDELLKKMIGIIMTNSAAEAGAIIIKEGMFGIAAHSTRTGCETFDPPMPLNDHNGLISTLVVHYVIHTRTTLFIPNIAEDTRFATGPWFTRAGANKSVICMPIIHKSTLVGVLYLQANLNAFTHKHVTVLHILCHQIAISVTNALLFKSVQRATQVNARMIESQRQALEEARKSREEALKATKLKSNFLANMSHELRTPFSGFYGMIVLLSETQLDAEQREFVGIAKQSCEMLLQIIDDLLDFSKLEARKVKLHYGLFYVEDLIEDRLELLITLASNKNLELTCFTDPKVPPMVYADGNRIGQILMNLIGNAIKFTQNGEVVVNCCVEEDTSDLREPLKEDELMLKFSVKDTGIGMTQEETKCLFLPFSQVDGSTTRNFGGTGLGLSICLELVRLMGGDIWVESQENVGSTFHFRVRVIHASVVAEPGVDADRRLHEMDEMMRQIGSPRVLLDTSRRQADMILAMLPDLEVEHVPPAVHSLELARDAAKHNKPFDYLIIDAPLSDTLRDMKRAIERDPTLADIKIIQLYSPVLEGIRKRQSRLGPELQDITRITKPVRRLKLLKALLHIQRQQEQTSPTSPVPLSAASSSVSSASLIQVTSAMATPISDKATPKDEADSLINTVSAENEAHEPSSIKPSYSSTYLQRGCEGFTPEELAIFQGQRILVAEDNPVAQKLIVKQLVRLGFQVETCNNGHECIERWRERGPDYYLLAWIDHHMPGCDGTEATKAIRKMEKEMKVTQPLPIIALTADVQTTAQQNCLDAGMTDYLVKPLMQKDLVSVLRKYALLSPLLHGTTAGSAPISASTTPTGSTKSVHTLRTAPI